MQPGKPHLMNAHVIKWWRWRIWVARQQRRLMAETFLIQWHNDEFEKAAQ